MKINLQAKVPIIAKATCEAAYDPVSKVAISDNQICAGAGQTDTCAGDSGGAMLSDQVQINTDQGRTRTILRVGCLR